jgi:hypothetical protein
VWHRRMRLLRNAFFLSVALADVVVTLLNTLPTGLYNVTWRWPWPEWACRAAGFGEVTPNLAAVLSLTAMSIDRYGTVSL